MTSGKPSNGAGLRTIAERLTQALATAAGPLLEAALQNGAHTALGERNARRPTPARGEAQAGLRASRGTASSSVRV